MGRYVLENDELRCEWDTLGAELVSVRDQTRGTEYLWNGDPAYWKRHSPVLFPLVGNVKNKEYQHEGKTYAMSQHGFARDMEFEVKSVQKDTLWFSLGDQPETRKVYPFPFLLEIGYYLAGRRITVMWRVQNTGDKTMWFSIGAHPAFCCPLDGEGAQTDCYLQFDTDEEILYSLIDENGLKAYENNLLPAAEDGTFQITQNLFDQDALIVEQNQAHKVSLLTKEKQPYVTVTFDAPLFGLWSPAGLCAPFVCIEPWYGRCDSREFQGEWKEREYGNQLEAAEVFEREYAMEFGVNR